MNKDFKKSYNALDNWLDNNKTSYDVSDIKSRKIFMQMYQLSQTSLLAKYLMAPFIIIAENYTNVFRHLFFIPKRIFAQGEAVKARAYIQDYNRNTNEQSLKKALSSLNWLLKNPSKGFKNMAWGQPYAWFSRKLFPENTPRATVTSQVANAMLDAYELTKETKYLDAAKSACRFFIDELNYTPDKDGDICFSYTTVDHFHIHNASILAAAVLIRTWFHTNLEEFKKMGIKAMQFTVKHQQEAGEWFYWAPPNKLIGKIDNYHTGFILEALQSIKKYLGNEYKYHEQLKKGLDFYLKKLFENNQIPRMTYKTKYPIDIQSAAQAIITLEEMKIDFPEIGNTAERIARWTIENMQDPKGFFYFRIYKSGRIDKTPYIRWAESWMLRALSYLN